MHPDFSEANLHPSTDPQAQSDHAEAQHGLHHENQRDDIPLSQRDERSSHHASGSEWSLSTSGATSPSPSSELELDFAETGSNSTREFFDKGHDETGKGQLQAEQPRLPTTRRSTTALRGGRFPLQYVPEEVLFHVLSHLTASDLLSVKLVSRRFHDIVKSPHAWINAFSKYFPGSDALARTADLAPSDTGAADLRSEKRAFTRLNPTASWTGEYLVRTKLLRCLGRGKPALPFAAPSPGKPNKGYATFTYNSRLNFGISHLHGKFGPIMDKRLPHFIHGFSTNGTVTSSDRRGKLDGWGLIHQGNFQSFSNLYPGTPQWGLGPGEVLGVPNIMDLSSTHGMVYGEGIPGGSVYYLANGEKNGRYLEHFPAVMPRGAGLPRITGETTAACCLWIAKSSAIPRLTKGLVGIFAGSSNGVVSAFSLGSPGDSHYRWDRGELTARWILSPCVPIVAVLADDGYCEERSEKRRAWAFAINALGEVFSLVNLPHRKNDTQLDSELDPEAAREVRAWEAGKTANWRLLRCSQREARALHSDDDAFPPYYPISVWDDEATTCNDVGPSATEIDAMLFKRPIDIRAEFQGWDMQRRVEADFAGDDGKGCGENIVIFDCGYDNEDDNQTSTARRYTRCALGTMRITRAGVNMATQDAVDRLHAGHSAERNIDFEWRCSHLSFGRFRNLKVTTTAIDISDFAMTTCSEDIRLGSNRQGFTGGSKSEYVNHPHTSDLLPLRIPGQRARFVAAGTTTGRVFIWDVRAPPSGSAGVTNIIRPLRVIHTESPEVTALALTALYLVHGGSEGLVQAWDPLASTLEPVRTISSRTTLNARRRAVIAAQQNPIVQAQMMTSNYAATAICLDPNPTVLRGIVAIGSHLRYWSYSSTAVADELSKSQKRRINRAARGLSTKAGDNFMGTRRVSLKGLVSREVAEQVLEEKDKRAAAKEQRRLAGRFGLDLLGHDASEEELIAYAKLLSEEQQEMREMGLAQEPLAKDASLRDIEAFKNELDGEDLERWQYASWQERFDMPKSHSATPTAAASSTPALGDVGEHDSDLEKAIRLSLGEDATPSPPPSRQALTPSRGARTRSQAHSSGSFDADMTEAIRLSLADSQQPPPATPHDEPTAPTSSRPLLEPSGDTEEDIAKAIRLSLQDQHHNAARRGSWSPVELDKAAPLADEAEFPALAVAGSGSPMLVGGRKKGKGKGKSSAAWD